MVPESIDRVLGSWGSMSPSQRHQQTTTQCIFEPKVTKVFLFRETVYTRYYTRITQKESFISPCWERVGWKVTTPVLYLRLVTICYTQ